MDTTINSTASNISATTNNTSKINTTNFSDASTLNTAQVNKSISTSIKIPGIMESFCYLTPTEVDEIGNNSCNECGRSASEHLTADQITAGLFAKTYFVYCPIIRTNESNFVINRDRHRKICIICGLSESIHPLNNDKSTREDMRANIDANKLTNDTLILDIILTSMFILFVSVLYNFVLSSTIILGYTLPILTRADILCTQMFPMVYVLILRYQISPQLIRAEFHRLRHKYFSINI